MHEITRRVFSLLLATSLLMVQGLVAAEDKVFPTDQLDQLVAPIALYPDSVVAQIMMASTYPLEVVQAQRWLENNKTLPAEELDKQGGEQGWDQSVVSMLHFTEVLKMLSENLDWTQDLGDAVLAQQKDVMDAVQRMRKRAYDEGNLESSEQQKVVVEQEVIRVEPITQVIYVPAYNPTVVYGSYPVATPYYPWYSYPPSYWYPPAYPAGAGLVAFGVGMAWGAAIWGDCNWGRGDIDIDVNRNTNIGNTNINNVSGKWQHNAEHRKGVRYKDDATRNRYDQASRAARDQRVARDADRGFDRSGNRDFRSSQRDGTAGDRALGGRSEQSGSLGERSGSSRDTGLRDRSVATTRDSSRDLGSNARSPASTRDSSSRVTGSSRASSGYRSSGSAFSSNHSGSSSRAASSRGASSRGGGASRSAGGRSGGRR